MARQADRAGKEKRINTLQNAVTQINDTLAESESADVSAFLELKEVRARPLSAHALELTLHPTTGVGARVEGDPDPARGHGGVEARDRGADATAAASQGGDRPRDPKARRGRCKLERASLLDDVCTISAADWDGAQAQLQELVMKRGAASQEADHYQRQVTKQSDIVDHRKTELGALLQSLEVRRPRHTRRDRKLTARATDDDGAGARTGGRRRPDRDEEEAGQVEAGDHGARECHQAGGAKV